MADFQIPMPDLQDDFGRYVDTLGQVPTDWLMAQPEIQEAYPELIDKLIWALVAVNKDGVFRVFSQTKDKTFSNYVGTVQTVIPRYKKESRERDSHFEKLQKENEALKKLNEELKSGGTRGL